MNLAYALAEALDTAGFRQAFGVSGANIEALFYALGQRPQVQVLLAKHEANAVTMAEGSFRVTGEPGLVLTTSGGGAFHTLAPLAEALASQVPILVIAGQIASDQEQKGGFQDSSGGLNRIDAECIFSPVSVATIKLKRASEIADAMHSLLYAAVQKRGPAVLLVPRELWDQAVSCFPIVKPDCSFPRPDANLLSAARKEVEEATQILVIAGKDIMFHGWQDDLKAFVQHNRAWVAVTPDAKGLWDHSAPEFVGLAGIMGHASVEQALLACDLVLIIGTSLPLMSRPSMDVLQQKKIIFLHSRSKPTFDGNGMRVILGDVPLILRDITRPWALTFQTPPARPQALEIPFQTGPHTVPMARAIHHLAEAFPPETDIFVDAGNTGAAAIHLYPQYGRSRFSVALGMGGMGHSFGCAIGATAVTKKRSLVIAGDGSFYMYGLEIHTAWEHQLPVVFVLFNNNGHAMCHIREALYLGTPGGANLFQPARLGAGMRAMLPGLPAFDVYNETELHAALQQIKNIEGPAVISIQTDPEEPPPFKPFLTRRPYAFPNTQS